MNYAVSDRFDLGHIGYNADLGIGQGVDNDAHCIGVCGDLHILLCARALYKILVIENAHRFADALTYALGFYRVVGGVKKLVFERAGAGVYD